MLLYCSVFPRKMSRDSINHNWTKNVQVILFLKPVQNKNYEYNDNYISVHSPINGNILIIISASYQYKCSSSLKLEGF